MVVGRAPAALAMAFAIPLAGCDDRWQDYNYKMTVWVGDQPYATVRHVELTERLTIQSSSGRRVDRKTTGQAVIIETPSGPVFALLVPEDGQFGNGFYGAYVAQPALVPAIDAPPESDVEGATREYRERRPGHDWLADDATKHNAMLEVKGARALPRTIPNPDPYRGPRDIPVWPKFVRFGDIADPKTVHQITPENVGVTRITIEVTDEDVTTGIEKRLVWLGKVRSTGGAIDGTRFPDNNNLPSNIGAGAFVIGASE